MKKSKSSLVKAKSPSIKNAEKLLAKAEKLSQEYIRNGLGSALGFPGNNGIGFPGNPYSEQLSDPTTIFRNLRWFLLSNYRQVLSEAYVQLGLIQTIVDVPVDDALRGGITIKSQELDEDEIKQLQISIDRDDDLNTVGQGAKWKRLFGGAGIIIMTDQDPSTPLNIKLIKKDSQLEFRSADMWELLWGQQEATEYDPTTQQQEYDYYNYYDLKLHKSRVMKLKGIEPPSFIRPRLRGWGVSVVETLVRSINQYLKATDLNFQVLDEFKIDVYRVKNLVNTLLSPQGQQKVMERFQQTNWIKNYQNAIVMDSEDEYQQKQLSFSGLAETMQGIRMQVASDMRMPMIKLFGTPATGLGADDESSIEVYNMMVESQVRSKIKYDVLQVCELKCQKLFEFIPEDLEIEFKPLRELSAIDTETVKTQIFTRAFQAKQGGELSTFEFRDICNKANLFPVRLDTNSDELNPDDPEIKEMVTEGTNQPEEETEGPEKEKKENSLAFEKASYEADGGDSQIDSRKEALFEHPPGVDWGLWQKCREEAKKIPGVKVWKFAAWKYKKMGGHGLP